MREITVPYGDGKLTFEVPAANLQEILLPNEVVFPQDELAEVERALSDPIGSPRIGEIVKPGQRVALICDDLSRPTPAAKILPLILKELNEAGIPDKSVCAVMALGSHRMMTAAEMERKVGTAVYRRIKVYNSQFHDKSGQKDLGLAPGGIHVWADRRAMEADIRIGLGSIVPHPAVGWSGGGKIIYPGITGEDTVAAYHLQHGRAGWNMFGADNSPVRLNMEQWVDTVGLHFIVNIIGAPDGRIYRAVAGHYVKAQRAGVEFAKELYAVKAQSRVEIAVVSAYPADCDFWQAAKGILAGDHLVKDGGLLILTAPCPEGVGPHADYMSILGVTDLDELLADIPPDSHAKGDPLAKPVAATVVRIGRRVRIALVSEGLTRAEVEEARMEYYETVEAALAAGLKDYGPRAKVSVLPYGAEVVPIVAP